MEDNNLDSTRNREQGHNKGLIKNDREGKKNMNGFETKRTFFGLEKKYLIPKGFYFFFFSAQGSLLPYLSLFLKQLELPASQVGIITGIKPYIAFFFIPIWSAVVDKYRISRLLFIISMLAINFGLVAYAFAPIDLCEEDHVVSKKTREAMFFQRPNLTSYMEKLSRMAEDSLDETPWPQSDEGTSFQYTGNAHGRETMGVFLYLLLVTVFSSTLSCPSLTLGDSATVQQLRDNNETHKYGKQRLWGSIGWGSMAFLVGAAVSRTHLCPHGSAKRKDVNYYPCFVAYGIFMLIALGFGIKLKFNDRSRDAKEKDGEENKNSHDNERPKTKGIIEGMRLLMTPRHTMFLVTVFVVGICMGFIKVFLFWHLKDLGGSQLLFSYMSAVNCIAEVTVYFLSSKLISTLGHVRVLYLGLFCYSIRLFFYAYITRPWYVLPIEVLSGITTAGVWASLMSYVGIHSIEGVTFTLQGILHSVHWGLGHGCGEFLGGFFISGFGASTTFTLFGIISLVDLLAYCLVDKYAHKERGYEEVSYSDPEPDH